MKTEKHILIHASMIFLFSVIGCNAFAQERGPGYGIAIEMLGTTTIGFGLNASCSPNAFFDLGLGVGSGTFMNAPEFHMFVRYNPIEFELSPFIQFSAGYFDRKIMDAIEEMPFFLRFHIGLKWQTCAGFLIGVSAGLSITKDFLLTSLPVIPGVFLGWTFY
jgi:hypothetical protein